MKTPFYIRAAYLSAVLLLSAILQCGCSDCRGERIYVSPQGNDAATGGKSSPLRTISAALERAEAGDEVILREGSYHEFVVPARSGEEGRPITLKGYRGETAAIDGTGLDITGWGNALVQLRGTSHFVVENLHIRNAVNSAPNADPEGIYIVGAAHDITIRDCRIYNIKSRCLESHANGDWRSAHAILAIGNDDNAPMRNLIIEGCEIFDIHSGTSESLTIAGNVDGFRVEGCKVHDVENIGIIVASGENLNRGGDLKVNFAHNGVVRGNEVYRCSHQNSKDFWQDVYRNPAAYGAIGIYVCGGASTVVEQNKVWECDRGIGLVSEYDYLPTRDCVVRNNFVYYNFRTGIYMGDYIGYTTAGTTGCIVAHNTLLGNNRVGGALTGGNNSAGIDDSADSEGEIRLTENCTGNSVVNNIIYMLRDGDFFIRKYTASGSGNTIRHNLYYAAEGASARWIWNGEPFDDFDAWQAASGDEGSLFGVDPLLRSADPAAPDLHLRAGSPAEGAGAALETAIAGERDIDGDPRRNGGKPVIGADI